jgi:polysaccharide pyruvyl transferase CsaB
MNVNQNIVICGYFGYRNAGDELILQSIIDGLKSRIKDLSITVLSSKPYQTMDFCNVKAVNRWNPVSVFYAIKNCDVMVSAGGLYQDITGSLSLYYYLALVLLAKLFRRKILLCSVDFGPVTHRFNKFILKKIVVRSRGSYEFLEKLGLSHMISSNRIRITADFILNDNIAVKPKVGATGDLKKVCLILRLPRKRYNLFNVVHFCESLTRRLNVQLVFVPFHLEQDVEFVNDILRNSNLCATVARWNKPKDLYDILSTVDLIISQRLHGLIIGIALGIPVLSISNDTKLAFFMRELNQERFFFTDFKVDTIIGALEDMWRWKDEFRKNIHKILPQLRYRAALNHNYVVESI